MYERFGLKDTAFPVTPRSADGVKWYGFPILRKRLSRTIRRSLEEPARVCLLNRGRWGAGKTHAAAFFSEPRNLRKPSGCPYDGVRTITVETPKQGGEAFYDLFKRIMNVVTFAAITKTTTTLRNHIGTESLYDALLDASQNEDIAHVLTHVCDDNLLETRAYLYGTVGLRDMKTIGAATKLTSDHDFSCALNGILWLLTHCSTDEKRPFNRVILWIDEMEDLVYFPTKHYLPFTQALRGVIDKSAEHLTLIVSFTFTEPEELETIGSVLGEAIMARINDHIVFEDSTEEDVTLYLLELLADNRVDDGEYADTHPFDEAAFEIITAACATHTPRYINKLCDGILRELAEQTTKKDGTILVSATDVENLLPTVASRLDT